jgi:hypothetical protein
MQLRVVLSSGPCTEEGVQIISANHFCSHWYTPRGRNSDRIVSKAVAEVEFEREGVHRDSSREDPGLQILSEF